MSYASRSVKMLGRWHQTIAPTSQARLLLSVSIVSMYNLATAPTITVRTTAPTITVRRALRFRMECLRCSSSRSSSDLCHHYHTSNRMVLCRVLFRRLQLSRRHLVPRVHRVRLCELWLCADVVLWPIGSLLELAPHTFACALERRRLSAVRFICICFLQKGADVHPLSRSLPPPRDSGSVQIVFRTTAATNDFVSCVSAWFCAVEFVEFPLVSQCWLSVAVVYICARNVRSVDRLHASPSAILFLLSVFYFLYSNMFIVLVHCIHSHAFMFTKWRSSCFVPF